MTTVYKVTDANLQTRGATQWGLGVERTAPGGGELCTDRWLHAYADPVLAAMMIPIHVDYVGPRMFRADATVGRDDGTKLGCTSIVLREEVTIPAVTTEQRIRFAILCAMEVTTDPAWRRWAKRWLSGKDRSSKAARARAGAAAWGASAASRAADAAWAATGAAAGAAADTAANAAAWASRAGADLVALAHRAIREES